MKRKCPYCGKKVLNLEKHIFSDCEAKIRKWQK